MDRSEARILLAQHLALYRRYSHDDLAKLIGTNSIVEVRGPSGTEYQIEMDVMWDSPRDRIDIRVMGAIDDGRLPGALLPLCDSFIVAPDGSSAGEKSDRS